MRGLNRWKSLVVTALAAATFSGVAAASLPAEDTVKIGHYGSLTGSKATFGKSTDNGIKLAVEEINAKGGVTVNGKKLKVVLVSDDTEGKPEKAGTVVTKLITRDGVVTVLGEVASSVSLNGAPVCQDYGVPMITPSSTNPDVTKVGDMISRVCFIDPFQGFACAKFAKDDLKAGKVAVLFDQASAYSVGLKDEFNKAFKELGGQIVSEQVYSEGAKDFNAQLTRIRESSPEAIFIPGYYSDIANIALQARKLGMKMPLIGGDGWDSEELAKNAGAAIDGCFYSNHYAPDQPTEIIQTFVSKYSKEFGGTPDGLAALGYDAANLLFDAMGRAKSLSGADLAKAISSTKDFKGVTGTITINSQRDAVKPVVIVERKNNTWAYRATIEPKKK
ncbi:MAG: ABC transporter substrate-binding protein [Phycisphaerales bacterium]|nr:ABC transporter substrate-binding protein [Phycisphaerales bacterium]